MPEVNDDGIDRSGFFVRWFQRAGGALAEHLTLFQTEGDIPGLEDWTELGSEAEYLDALLVLENLIEDQHRDLLITEKANRMADRAALVGAGLSMDVAVRLTPDDGTDPAMYVDPKRRTVREG